LDCTAHVALRHEKAFAFAEKGAHSGDEGLKAFGFFVEVDRQPAGRRDFYPESKWSFIYESDN
jgi:hypothetical protein